MPVNGKNKGSSYERRISNLFSSRFESVTGISNAFKRNADSGSFFGGSNQRRTQTHDLNHANFGDIICPNNFNFSIECKNYKNGPTFSAIVKGKVAQWDEWWKQALQDATNAKKDPLLIIKYNGTDDIIFLQHPVDDINTLIPYNGLQGYRLKDFLTLPDNYFFT